MEQKLYLVSLVGTYEGAEWDHSHYLFHDKNEALEKFKETIEEATQFYEECHEVYEIFDYPENCEFCLISEGGDRVDIYLMEITPDGRLHVLPF